MYAWYRTILIDGNRSSIQVCRLFAFCAIDWLDCTRTRRLELLGLVLIANQSYPSHRSRLKGNRPIADQTMLYDEEDTG